VIIWKTQNPWTALRGQMYDYYLDPNACLYGTRKGAESLHIMYNPLDGMVTGVNNTFNYERDMMLEVRTFDRLGHDSVLTKVFVEIGPASIQKYLSVKPMVDQLRKKEGVFLSLRLVKAGGQIVSDNFYWLPNEDGKYNGLAQLPSAGLHCSAKRIKPGVISVTLKNPADGAVAFFNRVSLVNAQHERILPVFYDDNYISVLPGETKTIEISGENVVKEGKAQVEVYGHNVQRQYIEIQ
jgi:hypothetical protein